MQEWGWHEFLGMGAFPGYCTLCTPACQWKRPSVDIGVLIKVSAISAFMLLRVRLLFLHVGYGGFMHLLIHDKMANNLLGLGAWLFRCLCQLSCTVYLSDFHQLQTSGSMRVILFFANPTVEMRNGPIVERRHVEDRGWFCRSKWGPISTKTWTVYTQEMVQISPNLFQ